MFKSIKHTRKGFTLIELLVVIAIIGILSSVVLASLSTARQKSRDAKRVSDVGQIQLALELFFDSTSSYPYSTAVANTATYDGGVQVLYTNNFIPKVPLPPSGNSPKYHYRGVNATGAECYSAGTGPCTSYAIAVTLERNDNTVLQSDADQVFTGWGAYTTLAGANAAAGQLYTATTNDDCAAATAGSEKCYDIKP